MSARRSKSPPLSGPCRRTKIVLAVFALATSLVTGVLALRESEPASGFLLTSVEVIGNTPPQRDPVFQISKPLDTKRWTGIVVHDLGEPAGDAESVTRKHLSYGYNGLGYHFLIGNGNGLGDGVVHVGYRWDQQLPGAHVSGRDTRAAQHNQHSIGICLIGNGDRRSFTNRQMAQLVSLVQRLQAELDIPASQVYLNQDITTIGSSPGTFFAAARFREQLLK